MPAYAADAASYVRTTIEDVRRAIQLRGAAALGPDGLPNSCWKGLGDLAVTALHDMLGTRTRAGSDEALMREYGSTDDRFGPCDCNGSLLVLLRKAGRHPRLGAYHRPSDT